MGAIKLHNPVRDKIVKEVFPSVDSMNDTNCSVNIGRPE